MESLSNYGGLTGPASAAGGYNNFLTKNNKNPAIFSQDLGNTRAARPEKARNNHFEMPRATATFNVSEIDTIS